METLQLIETKKLNCNGYVLININNEWKLEHVWIVEEFIGRKLNKGEVVHHIDSNKQNNRISNLFLFKSQKEHKSFENQRTRYGYFTNPMLRRIANRWNEYTKELTI